MASLRLLAGLLATAPMAVQASGSAPLPASAAILFEPTVDHRLRRATAEVRRYLYELSGELAQVVAVNGDGGGRNSSLLPELTAVLVAPASRLGLFHPALEQLAAEAPPAAGSHFVQLVRRLPGRSGAPPALLPVVVCSGIDEISTLYAVYSLMEQLGVRFRNHGDIIPRGGRGQPLASLLAQLPADSYYPERVIWQSPNMELRGSQPFFDFPAGPDWWGEEEYKHFFESMAKQKMNFLGLHTYKNEPTVWQDSNSSLNFDASGNVTAVDTYPHIQYTYTTTMGGWGQNATGTGWTATPGATSSYIFGAGQVENIPCKKLEGLKKHSRYLLPYSRHRCSGLTSCPPLAHRCTTRTATQLPP